MREDEKDRGGTEVEDGGDDPGFTYYYLAKNLVPFFFTMKLGFKAEGRTEESHPECEMRG